METMGLFNLGPPIEKRAQILFYDDESFEYRKAKVESASLVIKEDDKIKVGWPIFNELAKEFNGYKNMSAGTVMLCYIRDIIFNPFEKPKNDEETKIEEKKVSAWITDKADATAYKIENQRPRMTYIEKMTLYGFVIALLFALAIVLRVVTS